MWICIKIRILLISYQRYNKRAEYLNKYNDVRVLFVAIGKREGNFAGIGWNRWLYFWNF